MGTWVMLSTDKDLDIGGHFISDKVSLCTKHALQVADTDNPAELIKFFQPRLGLDGPFECPACKAEVSLARVGHEKWHHWPYQVEMFLCRRKRGGPVQYICWHCGTLTTDRDHKCEEMYA